MQYIFLFITLLSLQIRATEDQNVGKPANSAPPVSAPHFSSETDSRILLGCIKISNENYEKCNDKLIGIVNTLMISSKACGLLSTIKRMHGTIELCFPTETPTGAHWIKSIRTICIELGSTNNIGKFCYKLIWELCNAGNEFLEIPLTLSGICESQDIYSFLQEASEYHSLLKRNEILKDYFDKAKEIPKLKESLEQEANPKTSVDNISDDFLLQYENFMDYWTVVNMKNTGRSIHADLYRGAYQSIIHYCTTYGINAYESGSGARILTRWDQIGNDAESLIVYAFSQQSFDIAKKEQRILRNTQVDAPIQSRKQNLADVFQEKRKDQLMKALMGLYIWGQGD